MGRRRYPRSFVAIDGEAIDGKYVLLCASDRRWIYSEDELTTRECLDFLLGVKGRATKGGILVAFGLNYDVNMILRDLAMPKLVQLWQEGKTAISLDGYAYQLRWIPRKMFEVYSPDLRTRARIYDVFGFFQSSFVNALAAWKIEDPNGQVKAMKTERARFTREQEEDIRRYCLDECRLLVQLCERLEESLQAADISLVSYMGAGSVAGALLKRERVKKAHVDDDEYSAEIQHAIYCAYFGGRVEQFLQGIVKNVVGYDIRSAYPFEASHLPSLIDGEWRKASEDDIEDRNCQAIWNVEWDELDGDVMPFPLRQKGNEIYWPRNGRGWYHHPEVRAAMALHPKKLRILGGYIFEPANDERPFSFVQHYYELRQELKENGNAAEKAYKLGLNSLYGKLAQGISANGRPPFRSLFWAGRITAGTRARMLDAASLYPHGVVSIATDGIVFSGNPRIAESTALGGWERTKYDEIFIAQSGVYWARRKDGTETKRTRGFFLKEIDFEDLREGWLREGIFYSQPVACECGHIHGDEAGHRGRPRKCRRCECRRYRPRHRFVGLGAALLRSDFSVWRTWQPSSRLLGLHSSRKWYSHERPARVARLHPPSFDAILDSEPYRPKEHTLPLTEEMAELIEGFEQPELTPDA